MKIQNPKIFERVFDKISIQKEDFSDKFNKKPKLKLLKKFTHLAYYYAGKEYRKRWFFKNGFGISVIRGFGTYGFSKGLFELAVMDEKGIRYDTKITSDVIGFLTSKKVLKIGLRVSKLKNTSAKKGGYKNRI